MPCTTHKKGITLLNNTNPNTHTLLTQTNLEKRLEDIAKALRLNLALLTFNTIEEHEKKETAKQLRSLLSKEED
jgi:hypothetical protein